MTRYFTHLETTPEPSTGDKNVRVSLFNSNDELIGTETLQQFTAQEVYLKIDNREDIQLDNCLVKGFSLAEYRQKRQLKPNHIITLKNFSAINALFISVAEIDFSNALFSGRTAQFCRSSFYAPQLNLHKTQFKVDSIDFESCFFANETVDLSHSQFSAPTLSFKNAVFQPGKKNFEHCSFQNNKINFTNTEFNDGDISFATSQFADAILNFRFARFGSGKVSFYKCHFGHGEKNFESTDFNDGEFNFRSANLGSGKLNMTRAKFGEGDKSFVHSDFTKSTIVFVNTNFGNGTVSFKLAEFGEGKKDFHFCTLQGDLIFERAVMGKGTLDFRASEIHNGKISFTRFEIGSGGIDFDGASLQSMRILLKHSIIGSGAINFNAIKAANSYILFENIKTNETDIVFTRAKIDQLSLKNCHLDHYLDLRVLSCNKLNLSNTIVRDIIDLNPDEYDVDISELDISGMRLVGKIYLDWKQNNLKTLISNQQNTPSAKAEQFRLLKENFNSIGHYHNEDLAYVEFKRQEAIATRNDTASRSFSWKIYAHIEYLFKWLLFDIMGLYATSPVRVLASMAVVFMLFTVGFWGLSNLSIIETSIKSSLGDPDMLGSFERALYHSSITFLTIGYGDYYPSGLIRWLSSLEGFSGLFLMSYFTVAFVRKILR